MNTKPLSEQSSDYLIAAQRILTKEALARYVLGDYASIEDSTHDAIAREVEDITRDRLEQYDRIAPVSSAVQEMLRLQGQVHSMTTQRDALLVACKAIDALAQEQIESGTQTVSALESRVALLQDKARQAIASAEKDGAL